MSITKIPVDQRVIDIDSRRFVSTGKALVELITNSDDSYSRLEKKGLPVKGIIKIGYERHLNGAVISVTDQAEGMPFEYARSILSYGGAHSLMANGQVAGRGYFGRGLKQAIYGLGHGWIETIYQNRITRIDLYRSEIGEYVYDDFDGDRLAQEEDYTRFGIPLGTNGTQITVVIDNPEVNIPYFSSLAKMTTNNIYLREIINRRSIELVKMNSAPNEEESIMLHYEEPEAVTLIGPDEINSFRYKEQVFPYTLTLKKALQTNLVLKGDERTNGLLVISEKVVFDCQFFDHENKLGTEFLYGTVSCPAISEMLMNGYPVISDEREGLNLKEPFIAAFSSSVSKMISDTIKSEQLRLSHTDHATTSRRTQDLIEQVLQQMNEIATDELGIVLPRSGAGKHRIKSRIHQTPLHFASQFYYKKEAHIFSVKLYVDKKQLRGTKLLSFVYEIPDSIQIDPMIESIPISEIPKDGYFQWSIKGSESGEHGRILVKADSYATECDIVIAKQASRAENTIVPDEEAAKKHKPINFFKGYELRSLNNDIDRAVFNSEDRVILINTEAPTVRLYVNGQGQFKDGARLLLAELLLDVITDELARSYADIAKKNGQSLTYKQAKQDLIRRYGVVVHSILLGESTV